MKYKFAKCMLVITLLMCSVFLASCKDEPKQFEITTNVWYSSYGMVNGSGNYDENSMATITATPKNDSTFIAWISNNVIVSRSNSYTFKVTSSATYTAIFTCPELEFIVPTSIVVANEYQSTNIKKIELSINIGSSYSTLKNIYSAEINIANSQDEPLLPSLEIALNSKNIIYVSAELKFTYTEMNDEEITEHTTARTTKFGFLLKADELKSKQVFLNTPSSINGLTTIMFNFEKLNIKETK